MSQTQPSFPPTGLIPATTASKSPWELGEERLVARGQLSDSGALIPCKLSDAAWTLSLRSVERAGTYQPRFTEHVTTMIAGEFLELTSEGRAYGLEPLRPLKLSTASPIETSTPSELVLTLVAQAKNDQLRATVRIVELSKKRPQYLFDGQLGMLLSGSANFTRIQGEGTLAVRDTLLGSDSDEVSATGRGFLALISFDVI